MNPWDLLGRTATPGGDDLALMHRPGEYLILASGKPLMSSRMHGSEEALAEVACERAGGLSDPTVLIGGLGMGFTLRATLNVLPPDATVVVAELVAGVVEWNHGPLGHLAGHPLKDKRVQVEVGPVEALLRGSKARFDAVVLDVDNGPDAFTTSANGWLYADAGLAATRRALTGTGIAAVWSAHEDRRFEQRLKYAGFDVEVKRVRARLKQGGPRHVIFVGRLAGAGSNSRANAGAPARSRVGRRRSMPGSRRRSG